MNKNEEEQTNIINVKQRIIIPDIYLEEFVNSITENRIKNLYLKLKIYESKGYVTHDKYIISMKDIFDEPIKEIMKKKYDNMNYNNVNPTLDQNTKMEDIINEIYELYFLRFREMKCIVKNNKAVFYLTDFKPENYINSYNVICSLTIFFKNCFENKIKLLFNITDIDEDGFLNESEIRQMITTCNFLFCEESNIINTNSSILAQSLMNIRVNNILKEILYEPGNLYIILEEEKYINFDVLFRSIKLVKDYKYKIIPCYINIKQCLNNIKKEKIIQINDKYKYDFIKVSSSLVSNKTVLNFRSLKNHKNLSAQYLSTIIKPKKITKSTDNKLELPNINKNFFYKRNSVTRYTKKSLYNAIYKKKLNENNSNNLNNSIFSHTSELSRQINKNKLIIEKNKSFKELLRETTIIEIEDEKNKNGGNNKNFNKSSYYNRDNREIKYIFEANFDKIKNIEVEPGLIKFINGNNDNILSNNSNVASSHNVNTIFKPKNNIENFDYKKKNSEKSVNFNFNKDKDVHNNIVQEEKFSEDQENKSKTSNNEAKKMKKIKIINFSENQNDKAKTNNVIQDNNPKTVNKDNLNKLANFYRYPNSRQTSLRNKVNFINNKNIQKSIMALSINEGKRYKTLDEVFHEIKVQENKFNSDSYIGYSASLVKGLKNINQERKDIKKLLGESDKKDLSLSFHKNYLNKLAKRKKIVNIRSKSVK